MGKQLGGRKWPGSGNLILPSGVSSHAVCNAELKLFVGQVLLVETWAESVDPWVQPVVVKKDEMDVNNFSVTV